MTKEKNFIQSGRVLVRFNIGTKKHKSLKDYIRKVKHKKKIEEE